MCVPGVVCDCVCLVWCVHTCAWCGVCVVWCMHACAWYGVCMHMPGMVYACVCMVWCVHTGAWCGVCMVWCVHGVVCAWCGVCLVWCVRACAWYSCLFLQACEVAHSHAGRHQGKSRSLHRACPSLHLSFRLQKIPTPFPLALCCSAQAGPRVEPIQDGSLCILKLMRGQAQPPPWHW